MKRHVFLAAAVAVTGASLALADWNPGDPHKMHFPQLPDPAGWDVNFTFPLFVADDWRCSETGPVTDVHFWFSFEQDNIAPITGIHLSIHNDIPAGPSNPYSRPGDLLWERDFGVPDPNVTIRPYGIGPQGWADPMTGTWRRPDHEQFFQANIENIPNPFLQQLGTIYWLDISMTTATPSSRVGWKTSLQHFQDDAVWAQFHPGQPFGWQEVVDPAGHSLDMAFVITPTPASLALLVMGGVLLTGRRAR